MNQTILATLGIICIIAVVFAGCTGTPAGKTAATTAPASTPAKATPGHLNVGQAQNGSLIFMHVGDTLTLKLAENPTTGYQWNLTASSGLAVTSDTYVPSNTNTTMVGAGGIHVWEMTAKAPGMQSIDAIYKRSWEPTIGNETVFMMSVDVT